LERQVRLTIPPGGLDNGRPAGGFGIGVSTSSAEPFPDVEFVIGAPINDRVIVEEMGNPGWDWELPLPSECEDGCEIVILVTIEQIEEGDPPRFGWSAWYDVEYDGPMPAVAEDMTAVIEPANSE
jgi:hypothetical protein